MAVALDTAIKFGAGRVRAEQGLIAQLGEEMARFGKKMFIVAGPRSWDAVKEQLEPSRKAAGVEWELEIYTGWCCYEGAEELAAKAHAAGCDEIVGVGGGKIMDFAKAVGEVAKLGTINIPTSASTCAPFTCMSVMYTVEGGKKTSWRFDHEIDAVYMDYDVIAACPHRYNAAGILDAMAKKIEMLNGRPEMKLDDNPIDVFTAYNMAAYVYDVLAERGQQAIEDNRAGVYTKTLGDVAFLNVITTGVIANTTKSFRQSELAHVIYDGVRTHFTHEAADAIHGEIVGVGLFCQLYFNGLKEAEEELRTYMKAMDLPTTLGEIGIEPTEENIATIEEYIVNSRHYNSDDPADRVRLHEAVLEMV